MHGTFLIRNGESFLSHWEEGQTPLWIGVPSTAIHFDYQDADAVCQELRAKGFKWCYVSDVYGLEADLDVIQRDGHRYSDEEIEEQYRKAMAEVSAPVEGNER
jgi:hypothetical protein